MAETPTPYLDPTQIDVTKLLLGGQEKSDEPKVDTGSVIGKTLVDLLPLLATIGTTGIAYAAGARGQDLPAIAKIAGGVSSAGVGAYRKNREEAKYDLASKIVDSYMDQGIVDPSAVYKKFRNENPDLAESIDLGELYRRKSGEQSTILDLRQKQYRTQADADKDYETSKSYAFLHDGFVNSYDETKKPSLDYTKSGFSRMVSILSDNFSGKYRRQGNRFVFKDEEGYEKFVQKLRDENIDVEEALKYVETQDPLAAERLDIEREKLGLRKAELEDRKRRGAMNWSRYNLDLWKTAGVLSKEGIDVPLIRQIISGNGSGLTKEQRELFASASSKTEKGIAMRSLLNFIARTRFNPLPYIQGQKDWGDSSTSSTFLDLLSSFDIEEGEESVVPKVQSGGKKQGGTLNP